MKTVILLFLIGCVNPGSLATDIFFPDLDSTRQRIHLLEETLKFKRINERYSYYNQILLDSMRLLEMKGSKSQLYETLCYYVGEFGIDNFYKDTHLIWKLARLTENLGDPVGARQLYDLVLKHHNHLVPISEIIDYHDSVKHIELGSFVPDGYYEMLTDHSHTVDTISKDFGKLVSLGSKVNCPGPDYAPNFNEVNRTLLFTSQRNRLDLNSINEDLFVSVRDESGGWSQAQLVDHVNTPYNEGSACLSADGKRLFFSRCNSPDSYGNCDLYVADLEKDSTWGKVRNLGERVNSADWDSHPALSPNGDTLFFSSDRKGGFGMADLYFTCMDASGRWGKPQNLGPIVNTKDYDVSPYYHNKAHVLYFSSNGHPYSFGEFDIYKTALPNGEPCRSPVNLGPTVNRKGSETYFAIDTETSRIFFASSLDHNLRTQDLYSLPLPMEAQPTATTSLKGKVINELTNEPLPGLVTIIDMETGVESAPRFLTPEGDFEIKLIDRKKYLLVVRGENFFRVEKVFQLEGPQSLEVTVAPLDSVITFSSISYEFDSASVKPYMVADLNKLVKFMFDNPDYHLEISGHTDSEGSCEYNLLLSTNRARNITTYLVEAGIEGDRINYAGYGNTRPVVAEITSANQATNRRVEFVLYFAHPTNTNQSLTFKQ